MYTRSPAATVEIFRSLVMNHEEVDVEKALSAGSLPSHTNTTSTTTATTTTTNIATTTNISTTTATDTSNAILITENTHNEMDRDDFTYVIQEILLALPGILE